MRVFIAAICLLCLFRLLATISDWMNFPAVSRPHRESDRVLAIRGVILFALFVWGSWALWAGQ